MHVLFREGGKGGGLDEGGCFFAKKKKASSPPLFFLQRTKGGPESAKFVKEAEKIQNGSIKEPGNAL